MDGYENNNGKIMVAMDFRNVNTPLCEVAGDAPKDYSVLRETVLAGRPCNAVFAYDSLFRSGNRDQQQCTHDMLRDAGFTVRLSETPNKEDKQGHVDVFMALDVFRYVLNHDVDTVELITGDSDFHPLVKMLQDLGIKVRVWSFRSTLGQVYRMAADGVCYLDSVPMIEVRPVPSHEDASPVGEDVSVEEAAA